MNTSVIYRVLDRDAWRAARIAGRYAGAAHDRHDGFIHFSCADTLAETLALHYARRADQVLLEVPARRLGEALRWEPSRGGRPFPHLYAALPVAAVEKVHDLPLGPDGIHILPPLKT